MKSLLIAAAAGALLAPAAHDLVSTQTVSEIRRTTFEFNESSSLVETTMLMNGEEQGGMPEMEQEKSSSRNGTLVDHTQAAEGGALLSFEREYLDLASAHSFAMTDPMGGDHSEDGEATSGLEGLRVNFVKEDGEFAASFPDDQPGDDDLLDALDAELPWADFLPGSEVDTDEGWGLEPAVIWRTLHLGGDLAFENEDSDEEGMMSVSPPTDLDAVSFEGDVTATLAAIEEVDGVPHARVTLAIEFTCFQDLTDSMPDMDEEAPDDAPPGMGMPDIESMELETIFDGEGTLLWNMKSGLMTSLELELEVQETQTILMNMEMGAESMEIEQIMTFEGEQVLSVGVEVENE